MENQNENTQQTQEQNQSQASQAQTSNAGGSENAGLDKLVDTISTMIELKFKELGTDMGDRLTHFADDLRDELFKPTKEEIAEEKAAKRGGVF